MRERDGKIRNYGSVKERFEVIAPTFGVTDFRTDKRGNYINATTRAYNDMYRLGRADSRNNYGSHFVIGKVITNATGRGIFFSQKPKIHSDRHLAKQECARLAEEFSGETFIVYQSELARRYNDDKDSVQRLDLQLEKQALGFEPDKYCFADDGYGNLIKIKYHVKLAVYFHCLDNEYTRRHSKGIADITNIDNAICNTV